MKKFIRLGIAASLASPAIADVTFHSPMNDLGVKRDYLTCQETYSGGSITCGNSTSHYCYDPTLSESCCLLDDGYCKQGDSCAPVAGFCCHDGEDPSTCATRLSFTLPPPSAPSTTPPTPPPSFPTPLLAIANPTAAASTPAALTSTIQIQILAAASTAPLVIASPTPTDGFVVTLSSALSPDFTAMVGSGDGGGGGGGAGGNGTAAAAASSTGMGGGLGTKSATSSAETVLFTGGARGNYNFKGGDGMGIGQVLLGVLCGVGLGVVF